MGNENLSTSEPSAVEAVPTGLTAGVKYDAGKPRFDLLPHHAVLAMTRVLSFGARKYADNNWMNVPGGRWRYYRAAVGHLFKWWMSGGTARDEESGESHLAHAMACVAFLLDHEENALEFPRDREGRR